MNLPPVQLPDPPAKKPRKNAAANPKPRKTKKQAAAEAASGGDGSRTPPAAAAAAAAGSAGTPPPARKVGRPKGSGSKASGGAAGGGGATKSKARKDKTDDVDLELLEKEEIPKVEEEPEERLGKLHSGVFCKDLPWLMYGYGDADKPLKETVDLVEDIAVQFITDVVHTAMGAAAARNPGAPGASAAATAKKDDLRLEDLLFAVRRDPRKVARIQELIRRQQEIKEARKVMDMEAGGVEDMPE